MVPVSSEANIRDGRRDDANLCWILQPFPEEVHGNLPVPAQKGQIHHKPILPHDRLKYQADQPRKFTEDDR